MTEELVLEDTTELLISEIDAFLDSIKSKNIVEANDVVDFCLDLRLHAGSGDEADRPVE